MPTQDQLMNSVRMSAGDMPQPYVENWEMAVNSTSISPSNFHLSQPSSVKAIQGGLRD